MARSNLGRASGSEAEPPAARSSPQPEAELVVEIKPLIASQPTYGYRLFLFNSVQADKALEQIVEKATEDAVGAVRRPHDGTAAREAGGSTPKPPQAVAHSASVRKRRRGPVSGYSGATTGIDRSFGCVRRFSVTHAAAADRAQLTRVLDSRNLASSVWADTVYRSQAKSEPA